MRYENLINNFNKEVLYENKNISKETVEKLLNFELSGKDIYKYSLLNNLVVKLMENDFINTDIIIQNILENFHHNDYCNNILTTISLHKLQKSKVSLEYLMRNAGPNSFLYGDDNNTIDLLVTEFIANYTKKTLINQNKDLCQYLLNLCEDLVCNSNYSNKDIVDYLTQVTDALNSEYLNIRSNISKVYDITSHSLFKNNAIKKYSEILKIPIIAENEHYSKTIYNSLKNINTNSNIHIILIKFYKSKNFQFIESIILKNKFDLFIKRIEIIDNTKLIGLLDKYQGNDNVFSLIFNQQKEEDFIFMFNIFDDIDFVYIEQLMKLSSNERDKVENILSLTNQNKDTYTLDISNLLENISNDINSLLKFYLKDIKRSKQSLGYSKIKKQ